MKQNQVNIQDVANEATFAVSNLNRLSSSVNPNEIIWKQQDQYSGVKFSITRLTYNDKIGQITFDVSFDKNGETANLKSRTVSGFQIDDQQVNPDLIVDEEIERLKILNDNNQLVKNQEFIQIDLANWVQNPNSFLIALTNLRSDIFRYNVNAVHLNNNLILKELNHFIYQQYFQYQIIDLKINDENPG